MTSPDPAPGAPQPAEADHDRVELGAWLAAATDPQHLHHEALCAQTDPELFHLEKGESPARRR